MGYYLGIDGGGTKTAYLLADESGNVLAAAQTEGCSYLELGKKETVRRLAEGTKNCLIRAGISLEMLAGVGAGLPCLGENQKEDALMIGLLKKEFSGVPLCLVNDVEAGWAGSLGMEPGINIVAGTGSIAFGKNEKGKSERSGGWSTFFGDEGSCYWLGRRTMELFSKQADGRANKGALYDMVRKTLNLDSDMEFIACMEREYIPSRSKTASLQKLLLGAARAGDESAQSLYREAAKELAMMAGSIAASLWQGERVMVSYSGGLFHGREFVLPTLEEQVKEWNGKMVTPLFSPVQGAALLGAAQAGKERMERIKGHWINSADRKR